MTDINTPTGGDDEKRTKIQELTGEKKNEVSEALFGDKEAILKDLKQNHVKIENVARGHWYKDVHFELPAVGDFEGFKFNYSASYRHISKEDFDKNPTWRKLSYSVNEICKLLDAIRKYMGTLGIEIDRGVDYKLDMNTGATYTDIGVLTPSENSGKICNTATLGKMKYRCEAGDCLKEITGMDGLYRLIAKDKGEAKNPRAYFDCLGNSSHYCRCRNGHDGNDASLFLKLRK